MKHLALILVSLCLVAGASRNFSGSGEYFLNATAPFTNDPWTMAVWFDTDQSTITKTPISVSDSGGGVDYFDMNARMASTNDNLRINECTGAGDCNQFDMGSIKIAVNEWDLGIASFASNTDMDIYFAEPPYDRANINTVHDSSGGKTVDSADRLGVGIRATQVPGADWDGQLSMAGFWDEALVAREAEELGAGQWFSWIKTENLQAFYHLSGSFLIDLSGNGRLLVETGTTDDDDGGAPIHWPGGSP